MDTLRQQLLETAIELEKSNLSSLGPGKGSLSARRENGMILITPSGKTFSELTPDELVELDRNGQKTDQSLLNPSLDLIFHKAIYDARPDINAVIHTHSPYATAWACVNQPIQPMIVALVLMVGGEVPVAPFAFPRSPELGEKVASALGLKNAVLMENHGVIAVGKNLSKAMGCASTVENVARIQAISASIGVVRPLKPEVAEQAVKMESNYQ